MFSYLKAIIHKLKRSYILNKYDDFTIAAFFRQQGAEIGQHNRLEIRSMGTEPYLVTIGSHCTVAPNVSFVTHDGGVWIFTEEIPDLQKFGPIKILDNCFIGMGSVIMANVTIGPNAIVGAGSIVTRDVPANTIVAGNPARPVSSIETYREKALRAWERQKPPGYFDEIEPGKNYSPQYFQELKFRNLKMLREHLLRFFNGTDE